MVEQVCFTLARRTKGFHLITDEVLKAVTREIGELPKVGVLQLFIQHTSAALSISENADATVRSDLNDSFDRLAPEEAGYAHDDEGPDDMPAHVKSVLTGTSVSVPITDGRLRLGTRQGIYLCEFRRQATDRKIVATIIS